MFNSLEFLHNTLCELTILQALKIYVIEFKSDALALYNEDLSTASTMRLECSS